MRMFIVCSNRFGADQKCDVKIQTEHETRFEMTNGLIWHAVALGTETSAGAVRMNTTGGTCRRNTGS